MALAATSQDPAAPGTDADARDALRRELDAWAEAGRTATLWWRDDDTSAPGAGCWRCAATTTSRWRWR